ncbi:MAG: ABC transporter permease, partial [Pseudomonadota bacterium]
MEPLSWTGSIAFLNPLLLIAIAALTISIVVWILASIVLPEAQVTVNPDGTITSGGGLRGLIQTALQYSFFACVGVALAYLVLGIVMGTSAGIVGAISQQFLPVWVALIIMFAMSIAFKRRLGLYGKLYDSPIGMIGFGLVMFWVFTGIFGALDLIVTHDPLTQVSGMKNKVPGTPLPNPEDGQYAWYLLGGDNLARDVFSRMVSGAWIVVQIAPLATLFA